VVESGELGGGLLNFNEFEQKVCLVVEAAEAAFFCGEVNFELLPTL
jgi:hypothetical protein